jgi:hypothetical protein
MGSNGQDGVVSFSRDGKWIYFTSNRTGEFQIWRGAGGRQGKQCNGRAGAAGSRGNRSMAGISISPSLRRVVTVSGACPPWAGEPPPCGMLRWDFGWMSREAGYNTLTALVSMASVRCIFTPSPTVGAQSSRLPACPERTD